MFCILGYSKNSDGSANVICEAKGKKSVWKPSGKQIRCYGNYEIISYESYLMSHNATTTHNVI